MQTQTHKTDIGAGLTLRHAHPGSGVVGKPPPRKPRWVRLIFSWPGGEIGLIERPGEGARIAADLANLFRHPNPHSFTPQAFAITLDNPYVCWRDARYEVWLQAILD